jgi:hypothetical protein
MTGAIGKPLVGAFGTFFGGAGLCSLGCLAIGWARDELIKLLLADTRLLLDTHRLAAPPLALLLPLWLIG